ncbi:MAG: succinylglutamate desuccinylase/aspartoacylase family protein [Hyphomicrobiales bacterium]
MPFIADETISADGILRGLLVFDNPKLAGWKWPMAEIRGRSPGPRLCVMAGMHVNEVSSIEAVVQLQSRIAPEELRGTIAMLPLVNLPAMPHRSQYLCPIDGKNINFNFPGHERGSFSEALADAILADWAAEAEVLVDLHGGDLCENVAKFSICQEIGDAKFDARNLALARCFDAEIIVLLEPGLMEAPGRACTARARSKRHAAMSEAGANGIIDAVSVAFHLEGVLNIARLLGMIDAAPLRGKRRQIVVDRYLWIEAPAAGILRPDAEAGMRISKGQRLATLTDLFGTAKGEIQAPEAGVLLWRITHGMVAEGEKVFGLGGWSEARAELSSRVAAR